MHINIKTIKYTSITQCYFSTQIYKKPIGHTYRVESSYPIAYVLCNFKTTSNIYREMPHAAKRKICIKTSVIVENTLPSPPQIRIAFRTYTQYLRRLSVSHITQSKAFSVPASIPHTLHISLLSVICGKSVKHAYTCETRRSIVSFCSSYIRDAPPPTPHFTP